MRDTSCVVALIRNHAFLSNRFSNVRSATHSFRAPAPRRRSLTSSAVAAPENHFLPGDLEAQIEDFVEHYN
jgi:hypothetical protein